VRYLLSQAPETTAFILQGSSLGLIRQAAETARQLQPAIIVLEDADLVAADRDFSEGERPVLFEVLDVMDGLDDDADIAFVLTTNRVDVLEEALALRPGRIDLAVPIPLPSAALRARLFARSSRELPVTAAGCEAAAEAAAGTTGSFPKEAVRRAVLDALADGEPVDDERLVASVVALRAEGEELRAAMTEDAAAEWNEEFDPDEDATEWGEDGFAPDDEGHDGVEYPDGWNEQPGPAASWSTLARGARPGSDLDDDRDGGPVRRNASDVALRGGGAVGGMGAAGGLLSQRESGDADDEGEWPAEGNDGLGDGGLPEDDRLDDDLLEDGLSGEDLLDLDLEDD
jgi:hypothetical protein